MVDAFTLQLSEGTAIKTDFTARLSVSTDWKSAIALFARPQIHGQSDEEYSLKVPVPEEDY
jgi:hypothetical protein